MNYLIVIPVLTSNPKRSYTFPIGIGYVSSSLKQTKRNVISYNLNYKEGTVEENLRQVITENHIDVVMTGGLTGQYWQLEEIISCAKSINSDIITCVGGGIITSSPVYAMEALECVDYGMIGEGEITVCELAEAIEGKRSAHTVNGLIFRENGEWIVTAPREEITDLDSLPYPDYEGFGFDELVSKEPTDIIAGAEGRFGFVCFSRSCPFNCTFCFHPSGTKYRRRSMDSIFGEIDYLIERFGINVITVEDELFAAKLEDVREFCERVKQRNLRFTINLRVDRVNKKMLTLLRDSGCLWIGFGLESADNTVLSSMKKHITIEQIERALSLCNEVGIVFQGNFIFGDQAETFETAMNTINWWKAHPNYLIKLMMIICYPGSELFKIAVKNGVIKDPVQFIKDGCPYVNVSKMTDEEYHSIALLTSMLVHKEMKPLRRATVAYERSGRATLVGECPECGSLNRWESLEVYRAPTQELLCDNCRCSLAPIPANYTDDTDRLNWAKLSSHKIGIWPSIASVSEFFEKVPEAARSDNLFLIDKSSLKQGGNFKGKMIFSPEIIKKEKIDTVFISLATPVSMEIINEIKTSYPTVENIFFLGDLIDGNFKP